MEETQPVENFNQVRHYRVPEDMYKVDMEILTKYQGYSAELLRLSLAGLSVFGFLLTQEILTSSIKWFVIVSIVSFGVSAAFSLAHRFSSTKGLFYHIRSIRHEGKGNDGKIRNLIYKRSGIFLAISSAALGVGAISLCFGFIVAAL